MLLFIVSCFWQHTDHVLAQFDNTENGRYVKYIAEASIYSNSKGCDLFNIFSAYYTCCLKVFKESPGRKLRLPNEYGWFLYIYSDQFFPLRQIAMHSFFEVMGEKSPDFGTSWKTRESNFFDWKYYGSYRAISKWIQFARRAAEVPAKRKLRLPTVVAQRSIRWQSFASLIYCKRNMRFEKNLCMR